LNGKSDLFQKSCSPVGLRFITEVKGHYRFLAVIEFHHKRSFIFVQRFRPAAVPPPGPCRLQTRLRPLSDEVALEFRQGGEEVEGELPARRGGVNRFLEAFELDALRFQGVHPADQVFEGAAQAVEPPHHKRVAPAQDFQRFYKSRPLAERAADFVDEDLLAAGRPEGVVLEVKVLVGRGDPGVTD
jgi:hypothetical protein